MKDLNTRITEILSDAFAEMGVLNLRAVADAVIAELGLRIQVAGPDGIAYGKHRYVTDWTADE